jgi:hypothetical protein
VMALEISGIPVIGKKQESGSGGNNAK